METNSPSRGFDGRVWKNICFKASQLARRNAIPGMALEDYEQDLVLDLVHRSRWFDSDRASFRTFADRVTRHRAATLAQPTVKLHHERLAVSIDGSGNDGATVLNELTDEAARVEDTALARVDVGRFLNRLSPVLRQCCAMLQGDGIANEAKAAGMHRSTVYGHLHRLRAAAVSAGLGVYIKGMPDRSEVAPVREGMNAGSAGLLPESAMNNIIHPTVVRTFRELETWTRTAACGDAILYHRGLLALDRGAGSRLGKEAGDELDHIAIALMAMLESGQVNLVQRRHGPFDYEYFAVMARPHGHRASVRPARETAS